MATKTRRHQAPKKTRQAYDTDKQFVIKQIRKLADDVSLEQIRNEIDMVISIEESIKAADEGRVISHEEMMRRMKQWLSK